MDPIYLIALLPMSVLGAVYFMFFAKRDQAREYITSIMSDVDRTENDRQLRSDHHKTLLKRRKQETTVRGRKLETDLDRANLLIKPEEFLWICVGSAFVTFLILLFIFQLPLLLAIVLGLAGAFFPHLYLMMRIWMRMKKAAAQFADVLDMMVSCFKSGYGFTRAIQVVAENFEDPWSTELGKVVAEMNFGSSQEDALTHLAQRIPNPDVALFTTAVMIQKETGGNLAELLMNLSHTIRERYKLFSKVGALSAQGKLSAIIVFCIPFGLAGVFAAIMPKMMGDFVTNPIGMFLIGFALILQAVGGLVLKKIVSLEV